jgi:hypothetical protein
MCHRSGEGFCSNFRWLVDGASPRRSSIVQMHRTCADLRARAKPGAFKTRRRVPPIRRARLWRRRSRCSARAALSLASFQLVLPFLAQLKDYPPKPSPPAATYSRWTYIAGIRRRAAGAKSGSRQLVKNGSDGKTSAPALCCASVANAVSKSPMVMASRMRGQRRLGQPNANAIDVTRACRKTLSRCRRTRISASSRRRDLKQSHARG